MKSVFGLLFLSAISTIQSTLALNKNDCNNFPEAYPPIHGVGNEYCKMQPDLSQHKCSSTNDCLIYGAMTVCSNGYCSCGTLKSKNGGTSTVSFRLGPNPDLNSYFTHTCVIPKNELCPRGYEFNCETRYCYKCVCIDPPSEDHSYQANVKFPEGRDKSKCINISDKSKPTGSGFISDLEHTYEGPNVNGRLPGVWGHQTTYDDLMNKPITHNQTLTFQEVKVERRLHHGANSKEYLLPPELLLPNPIIYMKQAEVGRKLYIRHRSSTPTSNIDQDHGENGANGRAYSIFLIILIQAAFYCIRYLK